MSDVLSLSLLAVAVVCIVIGIYVSIDMNTNKENQAVKKNIKNDHARGSEPSRSNENTVLNEKHNAEIERLQKIEDEILEDIRNERYQQALLKVEMLRYSVDCNSSTKKEWDIKRKSLKKTLKELIEEKELDEME